MQFFLYFLDFSLRQELNIFFFARNMPSEKKKNDSTKEEAQYATDQYAAEQYAVNDYAVPADYTASQYTEGGEYATQGYTEEQQQQQQQQYDYSDPNNQYYADPSQYYYNYDYTTGTYVDPSAAGTTDAAAYNYDQYYAQQAYYDQSYHTPAPKSAYSGGAPLPEAVTAIQSQATASSNKFNQSSGYNSGSSQAPKVYYPSTANANNPVGPIIITKSGYAGPNAPNTPETNAPGAGGGAIAGGTDLKKKNKKKNTVRAAGGEVWEDKTLEDWDENDFRLFAGDLGNEVTEEILYKAFSKYPSLLRTRVVRDTRTMKSKGFGFISFKDPDDFVKAWREMNGNIP